MLLSKDLRDRYMNTLVQRLIKIGVFAAIEEIGYPDEKKEKYDWILNYSGKINKKKNIRFKKYWIDF